MTDASNPSPERAGLRWAVLSGTILVAIAVAVLLRDPLLLWFYGPPEQGQQRSDSRAQPGVAHYTCPMHPSIKQHEPGRCPICGMDLVAVSEEQQRQGIVLLDDARRQSIGVRTHTIAEAPMRRELRAPGRVVYDESRLHDVSLKVQGWVTRLSVDRVGQRVTRGQSLLTVYSPELYAAQLDFLLAQPTSAGSPAAPSRGSLAPLANSARQRLRLLGMSDTQIEQLATSKSALESISIPAPAGGIIIEKNVVDGASIEPGMRLYRIADLESVWLEADVYEADLPLTHAGQQVVVRLEHLPEQPVKAVIDSIYPFLDPATRTARVRVRIDNERLELRPGMYASVALDADLGTRLQVPSSAVIYTGPRRLVFVDLGEGRFRPQEIAIGVESAGMYEVLSGLKAGDVVASSGVFLLAAEARIAAATSYWDAPSPQPAEAEPNPAAPPPPAEARPKRAAPSGPTGQPASRSTTPAERTPMPAPTPEPAPAAVYSCPMHPEVTSDTPGRCPKCGMNLELTAPKAAPQ
jgi:membrane fusion protein, copper/silver efflux system